MRFRMIGIFVASVSLSVPAVSQTYSDSYVFMKAVKERDATKVVALVSASGSMVVNSRGRANGEGALHLLVRGRDQAWLAFLLDRGARPDLQSNRGETPLTLAAQIGWLEGAELLLARRASVDLANGRGESPLILATQRRDIAMVRLLMSGQADPSKTDNVGGLSALDYARQDPRAQAILRLLQGR